MKTYRSTLLKVAQNYCPAALTFAEQRAPMDRDFFAVGIAAHACAQAFGEQSATAENMEQIADQVVRELSQHGRSFDGVPEPPMKVQDAIDGRDIALAYFMEHPVPHGAHYEVGLAMDAEGQTTPYSGDSAVYKAKLDLLDFVEEEDEDWAMRGAIHEDYKTAWPTNESELDTLQLKGQAVLVFKAYGKDLEFIEQRVTNLRLKKTWSRRLFLDDDHDRALLARWEKDIWLEIEAADASRTPAPGACCLGCPWSLRCKAGNEHLSATLGMDDPAPDRVATALAVAEAQRKALFEVCKGLFKENPAVIEQGEVGYKRVDRRTALPDAHLVMLKEWLGDEFNEDEQGRVLGLLKSIKLSSSNVDAFIRALHPGRGTKELRDEVSSRLLELKSTKRFGVHKNS